MPLHRVNQRNDYDAAVALNGPPPRPTTPCKCCASITGKWWTGRRRRGTGPFGPKIYSSQWDLLSENLVQGHRRGSAGSLDYSGRNIPPDRVTLLAVAGRTTMRSAALIGFESLSEARRQGKKAGAFTHLRRRCREAGADNWRTRRVMRMKIHWRPAQPFVALMY